MTIALSSCGPPRRAIIRTAAPLAALAVCASCTLVYEWHDERCFRKVLKRGEQRAREHLDAVRASRRLIGCRTLAIIAREQRIENNAGHAADLARELIAHHARESRPRVRAAIVGVCLRNAGVGVDEATQLLTSELTSGEFPVAAAYTLASLRPAGAFQAISMAYAAAPADAYPLRYELLGALWLLGDVRAIPVIEAALAEMTAPASRWDERIYRMERARYAKALASRLARLRAVAAATAAGGT
jgi:hypothetical protein